MEKERKIEAPEGCEIEKVEIVDGADVITFREKERKLPKSWAEFCEMFPMPPGFVREKNDNDPFWGDFFAGYNNRLVDTMHEFTNNRATAEAILALCQLIQLRDAYNGDWVPNWSNYLEDKFVIDICNGIIRADIYGAATALLYFETEELRDEFLRNFRPLIEKIKPLYGIKEGGEG